MGDRLSSRFKFNLLILKLAIILIMVISLSQADSLYNFNGVLPAGFLIMSQFAPRNFQRQRLPYFPYQLQRRQFYPPQFPAPVPIGSGGNQVFNQYNPAGFPIFHQFPASRPVFNNFVNVPFGGGSRYFPPAPVPARVPPPEYSQHFSPFIGQTGQGPRLWPHPFDGHQIWRQKVQSTPYQYIPPQQQYQQQQNPFQQQLNGPGINNFQNQLSPVASPAIVPNVVPTYQQPQFQQQQQPRPVLNVIVNPTTATKNPQTTIQQQPTTIQQQPATISQLSRIITPPKPQPVPAAISTRQQQPNYENTAPTTIPYPTGPTPTTINSNGQQQQPAAAATAEKRIEIAPHVPFTRTKLPYYSQNDLDEHLEHLQNHTETEKDAKFEDNSDQMQWYLRQAKKVLRKHNVKKPKPSRKKRHHKVKY